MSDEKVKKRQWAFVAYPDSLPDNWLELLMATGLPCAVSPLHDKDVEPDGTPKKAHRHVLCVWPGPATYLTAKRVSDQLNAARPIPLEAVRGYYRYFTHKDNPEKYQYSESEIICLNGFDVSNFVELTRAEINEAKRKVQAYIRQAHIVEYADLMDALYDEPEMTVEWEVASSNTFFFAEYIKSVWRRELGRSPADVRKDICKNDAVE